MVFAFLAASSASRHRYRKATKLKGTFSRVIRPTASASAAKGSWNSRWQIGISVGTVGKRYHLMTIMMLKHALRRICSDDWNASGSWCSGKRNYGRQQSWWASKDGRVYPMPFWAVSMWPCSDLGSSLGLGLIHNVQHRLESVPWYIYMCAWGSAHMDVVCQLLSEMRRG